MSPTQTTPQRKPARRKKKGRSALSLWWPVLLGVAITPLTMRAADVLTLEGTRSLGLLYPYVLLFRSDALGLSGELGTNLSQLLIYLQFPIYGLLMALTLRTKSVVAGFGSAALMHVSAVFVLFLISRTGTHA